MRKLLVFIFLLFALINRGFTQGGYPIFVTPTLTPPYSLKLSEYSKFGSQRLVVSIAVNDLNISNLPVKLHVKLETVGVTIETPATISTTPIYLDGGAATILFGEDLADYFNINNLIFKGYSKETYRATGQLPEGFYRVTVEVLHYQTNRLISNSGSVSAWMALGKPPVLKLPENNQVMGEFPGMPLVFSWLPCNPGNPLSAGSVQYRFEMWELRVEGVSPYVVASTVPVFYEETTQNTLLSVYPVSLPMEPGMQYAWRVTASDMNGLVPFEQDGHSEVRVFTYRSRCNPVTGFTARAQGRIGLFSWQPEGNHTSYNVELQNPNTGWFSASETFNSLVELHDLEYGSAYEMRVQAVCNGDPTSLSDFTAWHRLDIPNPPPPPDSASCPNCGCDNNVVQQEVDNLELKRDLAPGDTLVNRSGTTRFIVKTVNPQGDGVYKGIFLFWAELWRVKFVCEYWDLSANTDNVILNMDFKSVYNPQFLLDVDVMTAYLDSLADAITTLTINTSISDTLTVSDSIVTTYVNEGDSVIVVTVGENGELTEIVIGTSSDDLGHTLITGEDGGEYVVTGNGEVMGVDEFLQTGGNDRLVEELKEERESHLSDTTVNFAASPTQAYGFDAYTEQKQALRNGYPALGNGYVPSYKSVASFATDRVVPSSFEKGITFRDEMGIPAVTTGGELTLRGSADGAATSLYAYKAVTDTTEEVAGKLEVLSYDPQVKKLYIVPVNGAQLPDAATLQNVLNAVYAQAVTRWEVVPVTGGVSVAFPNGHMSHGGTGAIGVYNADQNAIISTFKESYVLEGSALYLFFVEGVEDKGGDIAGYMPLQRQVGFIYDSPNLFVVAHELGHGAFNLRHTFSPENFIAAERTTQNLMDYNGGTELWKHQWESIRDPQNVWFAWAQDEEEGEAMNLNMSEESIKGVIDLIRESNIANKETIDLSLFSLSKGSCINLKLSDDFTLEYVEVKIGSGKYMGDQDNPFPCEPLTISPMGLNSVNIATPPSQNGNFVQIYFNRFDQAAPPRTGVVESESVGVSFIIKEAQKDEFEAYLNNELWANATWVSQFNSTFFGHCTCFSSSCCFYTSQYIVKQSTELYSPNGSQIAISRFPINNAPLIDMQTPVSVPSGFTLGVAYLDASLAEGKPIVVGVYYRGRQEIQQLRTTEAQELLNVAQAELDELSNEIQNIEETQELLELRAEKEQALEIAQQNYNKASQKGPFNSVEPTFHFVVVVGKGYDVEQQREYYRYYEVGTDVQSNGTHKQNRFYIYDDELKGSQGYSSKEYIVTEVRQHSQSGDDCP